MYSLLLLNGGVGSRVGAKQPKQFLKINGIPMVIYSAIKADACELVSEIIINYPKDCLEETKRLLADYGVKTPIKFVEAGKTRHESVLKMLEESINELVLIHEAARPVLYDDTFENLVKSPYENVSYMLEIPFTVAPVDPENQRVVGSLDRSTLRNVQLPQKFNKQDLLHAHQAAKADDIEFTEDATLCAHYGKEVFFINGYDYNIKVTTKFDVKIVTHILKLSSGEE